MDLSKLNAACQTVAASYWKLWLARIFGKRQESTDSESRMVCHIWRGTTYMTDFELVPRRAV